MINKTEILVRYQETDQMGVVYHANYFVWFEVGRTDFFKKIGLSYRELETMGILFPVLSCSCKFHSAALYDDLLEVRTRVSAICGIRVCLTYQIYRDDQLLAEGETVHVFVDKNRRPLNMKKLYPNIWEKLNTIVCDGSLA